MHSTLWKPEMFSIKFVSYICRKGEIILKTNQDRNRHTQTDMTIIKVNLLAGVLFLLATWHVTLF